MYELLYFNDFPECQNYKLLVKDSNKNNLIDECKKLLKQAEYCNSKTMLCIMDNGHVIHPVISDLKGRTTHPRKDDWIWLTGTRYTAEEREKNHKKFTKKLKSHMQGIVTPVMIAIEKSAAKNCQVKQAITAKKENKNISNAAESSLSPAKLPAMPEYSGADELKDIYDLAKNIFDNVRNNEEINKYAVGYPILWFGNLNAYRKSTIKILTVGINPSEDEFPNNTFRRFPAWNELSVENYFKGLNEYFNEEAYNWFTQLSNSISFDEIWNCSYITDQRPNTALHVDFCTPIATNPTWSNGLPANVQSYLQEIQIDYFQRLLAFLNPDIVFIGSKQCESWQTLNVLELLISCEYKNNSPEVSSLIEKLTTLKGKPHNNRCQLRCLKSTHGAFVITGQYRNRPFAVYAQKRLRPIMAAIKKYYSNKFKK